MWEPKGEISPLVADSKSLGTVALRRADLWLWASPTRRPCGELGALRAGPQTPFHKRWRSKSLKWVLGREQRVKAHWVTFTERCEGVCWAFRLLAASSSVGLLEPVAWGPLVYLWEDTRTRHETDGAQVDWSKGAKHSARRVREYLKRLQSKSCSQPVCCIGEVQGRVWDYGRVSTSPPRASFPYGTEKACQGTGGPGQCK